VLAAIVVVVRVAYPDWFMEKPTRKKW